ncbi:DUF1631 domain-containing protein [Microbulbifer yueqingensis]|nr:DUF1631 domain-containing protein [Microbulbifer yueqingensis]
MENPDKVVAIGKRLSDSSEDRRAPAGSPSVMILDALQQQVSGQLHEQLKRMYARTDDSLFAMAERAHGQAEQDGLFQALRLLRVERRNISARFSGYLQNAFELKEIAPPKTDRESGGSLSLVQNDELEQMVAVDTMVANARRDYSQPLSELCLRLGSLYRNKVYEKNLPLGPGVLCDAFVAAAWPLDIHIRARLTLLKKFEQEVIQQLGKVYEVANRLLVEHGILPDLRPQGKVKQGPRRGDATPPREPQSVVEGPAPAGGAGAQGVVGLVPFGAGAVPLATGDLLAHLGALQDQVPAESASGLKPLDVGNLLQHYLVQRNQAASLDRADGEVIKLVEMLFSFIVEDRNLAQPAKALLGRLQLPLLRVAIADKSFFSKGGHPARKLLNELADAATGWQPPEAYDRDPLYREMQAVVERVQAEFNQDVGLFEELLSHFREQVSRQRTRAELLEKRIVDEADSRARAEAARVRVSAVLEALTSGRDLPPVVNEWLEKVWRQSLFLTCVKSGPDSEAWSSEVRAVRDLVWSVEAPMPAYARQLQALLPSLQARLRESARAVSLAHIDARHLFGGLKEVYRQRFDSARAATGQVPAQRETPSGNGGDPEQEFPAVEELEQAAEQAGPAGEPAGEGGLAPLAEDDPHWQQTFRLGQGSWFELRRSDHEGFRCRLAAVIRDIEQFIFVNRNGAKVAQFSRLELAHALRSGQLLPLDDGMLFERALQSVIGRSRYWREEKL